MPGNDPHRLFIALLTCLLFATPARAETYGADGILDDPDHSEEFLVPIGQTRTVTGNTSYHGVSITGNPNQGIPQVSWELTLEMPGATKVSAPSMAMNITLDGAGLWSHETALSQVSAARPLGTYTATIRSEIYVGTLSKALFNHSHTFYILEDP
jgi:hypothetical protein